MGATLAGMGARLLGGAGAGAEAAGPVLSAVSGMVKPQQRELGGFKDMMINAGRKMNSPAGMSMMQSIPGLFGHEQPQQMDKNNPEWARMIAEMLRNGTGSGR